MGKSDDLTITLNSLGCRSLTSVALEYLVVHAVALQELDLSGCYKIDGETLCLFVDRCPRLKPERHSALKLEKSAISKVQKSIIYIFKNGKKSIFAPEKSPKMAFLVVLMLFLMQKLIFYHF